MTVSGPANSSLVEPSSESVFALLDFIYKGYSVSQSSQTASCLTGLCISAALLKAGDFGISDKPFMITDDGSELDHLVYPIYSEIGAPKKSDFVARNAGAGINR